MNGAKKGDNVEGDCIVFGIVEAGAAKRGREIKE
jgi:hypothetical protein